MVEQVRAVKRSSLLVGLPAEELQRVQERLVQVSFKPSETVILQGSEPGALFFLISGVLSVDVERSPGTPVPVDRLIPGECAGELSLLTGLPASATVRALTDSECWVLSHQNFTVLLETCPTLAQNFTVMLGRRLYQTTTHDHRPGVSHLMRLRVSSGTPIGLPEAIARAIARLRRMPILVLDERQETAWSESERAPDLDVIIGHDGIWDRLCPRSGARPVVSHARDFTGETWARMEAWLPQDLTHAVLITEMLTAPERLPFPDMIEAEVKRDLTLWRSAAGSVPADTVDLALLTRQAQANTVRSLESSTREWGHRVVRHCLGDGISPLEQDIEWLARHLAGMKVGLTLGSGGARGFAHLGVVDALRTLGIPIDYIGGCSIGACVGACYASGLTSDTILHTLADFAHAAFRPTIPRHSLASNSGFVRVVQRMWGDYKIEDTATPLAVVATDIIKGREVVLDHGLLWKAVTASASIPGIYPPIICDQYYLVDGGVVDPMPVAATRQLGADVVIAVKLGGDVWHEPEGVTVTDNESPHVLPSLFDLVHHAFELMCTDVYTRQTIPGDVTVVVDVPVIPVRDFAKGVAYIADGKQALIDALPELATLLPWIVDSIPA